MYVIIDTETTGLSLKNDRIIELAAIGLDADGRKEWEWCSLINPERDTGHGMAVRVHQIYSRDVAEAPTFAEFAGHIAHILRGQVVIAHNAKFDLGMLDAEFSRLSVKIPSFTQICTADMARDRGFRPWRLESCCSILGIEIEGEHHALADARATLCLAHKLFDFSHKDLRKQILSRIRQDDPWPELPLITKQAVTRPILPCRHSQHRNTKDTSTIEESLQRIPPVVKALPIDRDCPETKYLAAVEWVIEDRHISTDQRQALVDLQAELKLTDDQVQGVHFNFIRGLAGSIWPDGVVSSHEKYDIEVCGLALNLTKNEIEDALKNPANLDLVNDNYKLKPGTRVVFTGEMSIPRSEWSRRAEAAGLQVAGSVSAKTDFLIVPFEDTGSTKTQRARALGVRVISEQRFIRMIRRIET